MNSNLIRARIHDLDLSYNKLNLIEKVSRDGATLANYSYLSDGTKISATNASGDGLVYIGSLVYRKRGDSLSLESAGFNGGRFVATNTGIEPRYFLTDHLGSTRVVVNSSGKVLERNDYHTYGKRWTDANSLLSDNRYGYNGKEKQDFVSLPYIDYGARQYDPIAGMRWNGLDQLSEKHANMSPYVFCCDNAIKYWDADGKDAKIAIDDKTKTITVSANIIIIPERGVGTDVAAYFEKAILEAWDKDWIYTDEGNATYNVKFDVSVRMVRLGEKYDFNGENNYIKVTTSKNLISYTTLNRGVWTKGSASRNSAAHEFGHILGLDDKYDRTSESREALPGWETNIMAGSFDENGEARRVDQRNIDAILTDAIKLGAKVFYINETNSEIK